MARQKSAKKTTQNEKEAPNECLARLRKERNITQKEMALKLGISQGNISDYERGALRLHGQLIIEFAQILKVSADEILGIAPSATPKAISDKRLLRRIVQIDKLSKRDRDAVVRTVDAFLGKAV